MYGLLHGPSSSSCGGLQPSAEGFFALRAKKSSFHVALFILGHFQCSVETLVTLKKTKTKKQTKQKKKNNPKKTMTKKHKIPEKNPNCVKLDICV